MMARKMFDVDFPIAMTFDVNFAIAKTTDELFEHKFYLHGKG